MVWDRELSIEEVNAVRNVRLNPTLDYSPADAEQLFDLFSAASGSVVVAGTTWYYGFVTGTEPGELIETAGEFELRLDDANGVGVRTTIPTNCVSGSLVGYYEVEGGYASSAGTLGPAVPTENPAEVNILGAGFRGSAADINDPVANGGGNSGGSLNVPYDADPDVSPEVTFGGWFRLDSNAGFPGVVAIDQGGWDRGIHLFGNNWGFASGGSTPNVAPAALGQWTYVVGTFNKPANRATLYVGDDVAATQTTTTGTRPDGGNPPGLAEIEIGRYDNQDLDAQVDDFMVWNRELTVEEANAVRNVRLNPNLDYSPADADQLFCLFSAGSGSVTIDGIEWTVGAVGGTQPGELLDLGGTYELRLDNVGGNGVLGAPACPIEVLAEDFETPVFANNTGNPAFSGWTWVNGNNVKARNAQGTSDVPDDNWPTPPPNQIIQFEWTNARANYDLSHSWGAGEAYTLSLNASPQSWNGTQDRFIRTTVSEQVSGDVLWTRTDLMPQYAGFGRSPWTASQTFDYTIISDGFTTGTAGSALRLTVEHTGFRGIYVDNVSFTVECEVPEDTNAPGPAEFALGPVGGCGAVTMTAATAVDDQFAVEYFFTETSGNPGGDDSGWQSSPSYTDTGLDDSTTYTYTVKVRDTSPNQNESAESSPANATTQDPNSPTLLDEDFEDPVFANNTANPGFVGWSFVNGNNVKARNAQGTSD
ncbi:MAG: LamG-like jellyroll fold domain-containing protein, partial [Verrucomicrobiota bacterium]